MGALSWFPDGQNTTVLFCFAFFLSFLFFFLKKGLSHHVIIISATSSSIRICIHTGAGAVFIDTENCINIHVQLSTGNSKKQSLITQ